MESCFHSGRRDSSSYSVCLVWYCSEALSIDDYRSGVVGPERNKLDDRYCYRFLSLWYLLWYISVIVFDRQRTSGSIIQVSHDVTGKPMTSLSFRRSNSNNFMIYPGNHRLHSK